MLSSQTVWENDTKATGMIYSSKNADVLSMLKGLYLWKYKAMDMWP